MWLQIIITLVIYFFIALLFSSLEHSYFNRKLLGGLWGAFFFGFVGAAIGAFAFDWICVQIGIFLEKLVWLIHWLMRNSDHNIMPPVNVIAAVLGSIFLIFILRKMTPDN